MGPLDRDQVEFSKPTVRQKLGRPLRRQISTGGGSKGAVPAVPPTLPGPGGGESRPLANAGDASPALCRAGLGYGAGAGNAPLWVAGGLRNSSPHSVPSEPQLIGGLWRAGQAKGEALNGKGICEGGRGEPGGRNLAGCEELV